ncbi:MAG: hypothetical protein ACXWKG_11140 [Limisphaerales bacterium]
MQRTEEESKSERISREQSRAFEFERDTFAFPNELVWEYRIDPVTRKTTVRKNDPPPSYTLHCFVVVRAAKQFLLHANFVPSNAPLTDAQFATLIRELMRRSPQTASNDKISIPGFADLREFTAAKKELFQANCGGAWQSYVQRGNWRMVFPFSRSHQEREAKSLLNRIGTLPIVHIVTFPRLSINHGIMLFDARDSEDRVEFLAYDPNIVDRPVHLWFDKTSRSFNFPANHYFAGGKVAAYEIYRGLFF